MILTSLFYFNPRPPWGGRLPTVDFNAIEELFQSTPSVGRATASLSLPAESLNISIHALRGEGDFQA